MLLSKCTSVLLFFAVFAYICDAEVKVKLKQGLLSGVEKETLLNKHKYHAFIGIPYALPPINELRFQLPKEHPGWDETYVADENKPPCIQYKIKMRFGEKFGISGAEDCLYVNVFTPTFEKSLPVIVFEYNDQMQTSYNGTEVYSPDFLIEEEFVVVTINHRLGVFGFLTTEDEVIPANAGIKDFILGLQWIQENIEKFGGDPNRITIIGGGGGATIANILLYTKKAKGLFHKVILQSGTAFEPTYFYSNPKEKAFSIGKELGIVTDESQILLQKLQELDAKTLITNVSSIADQETIDTIQMKVTYFAVVVEQNNPDAVITALPEDSEIINDVPVLMGFNSREGLDSVSHLISEPRLLDSMDTGSYIHFPIRPKFRFDKNDTIYEKALQEIRGFYLNGDNLNFRNILDYAVYMQDQTNAIAIEETVKKLSSKLKSSLFYYMFDYRGSLNENSNYISKHARFSIKHWGATVTDELCYLVVCSRIKYAYEQFNKHISEQPEMKVLKKMVRMWSNFVKFGNPTPSGDELLKKITWLPVDNDSNDIKYLHITKSPRTKLNPLEERTKFWTEFLNKYSKLAVDGVVRDRTANEEL